VTDISETSTNNSTEKVTDRDYWLPAEEAKNFGIIDAVITKRTGDVSALRPDSTTPKEDNQ